MRKLGFLLVSLMGACLVTSAFGQADNPQIQFVTSTPSGSCSATGIRLLTPNGTFYTCQSGMWAAISGGGGGASPAGVQFDVDFTGAGATTFDVITGQFRVSTPVIGTTPNPGVVATCSGTCMTTYSYVAVARGVVATSLVKSSQVDVLNASSLDSMHHNVITPGACITNQTSTDVYRVAPALAFNSPMLIANVACAGNYDDTGITAYGPTFNGALSSWPSSQGLLVPGTIRSTSNNGLAVGPEYLYKVRTNPTDIFIGGLADSGWEVVVDIQGGSSAGMYNTFTIYNANAANGQISKSMSQWFCDGKLNNDGTNALQDCGISDESTGNPTSGIAIFTLSPVDSFWNCTSPCGTIDTGGTFFFGSVVSTKVQASGYKSSDGTEGVTGATCSAWKNGLCVAN